MLQVINPFCCKRQDTNSDNEIQGKSPQLNNKLSILFAILKPFDTSVLN
jgi:hypothetical protein